MWDQDVQNRQELTFDINSKCYTIERIAHRWRRPTHHVLLGAGVLTVYGLCLTECPLGAMGFCACP